MRVRRWKPIVVILTLFHLASPGCREPAERLAPPHAAAAVVVEPALGKVDPRWLERARRHDGERSAAQLVTELARAHPSKALAPGAAVGEEAYLKVVTANLDEDPEPEHLLLIGADAAHTMFYVIDRRGEDQAIVFAEFLDMFNEEPELHVLDRQAGKAFFYLRTLHERGSGLWLFTWRFFALDGGRVVPVLETVQESNLALEVSEIYQHAASKVQSATNGLVVTYEYQFQASQRLLVDLGVRKDGSDEPDVKLVAGREKVRYAWDAERKRLVPSLAGTALSEDKLRCLMVLGDEPLFASAFRRELEALAQRGSPAQKAAASHFLRSPVGTSR